MLARKYDEYAWEINEEQQYTEKRMARAQKPKQHNYKLLRRRVFVVATIIIATYFACVGAGGVKAAGGSFDAGKQRGAHCC